MVLVNWIEDDFMQMFRIELYIYIINYEAQGFDILINLVAYTLDSILAE